MVLWYFYVLVMRYSNVHSIKSYYEQKLQCHVNLHSTLYIVYMYIYTCMCMYMHVTPSAINEANRETS